MIISPKRFRETLDRVPSPELARLINDSVAFNSQLREGQNVPWKEFEKALDSFAPHILDPSLEHFNGRSVDELRAMLSSRGPVRTDTGQEAVRLERVVLKNFGSYRNETTLELSPNGEKNVTVVVAGNGEGKTTLFNAINWALFGDDFLKELLDTQGKDRADLVNFRAADELREGMPEVETSVVLWFQVGGDRYYVRRRFSSTLLGNGTISASLVSTSLFKSERSGNHVPMPEDRLPGLLRSLPKSVKEFYLFDGEHINQFASPGSQLAVMSAIRRILGVEVLERAQTNTAEMAKRLRTAYNREAPSDVKQLADEEQAKRNLIAHREAETERLKTSVIELQGMIRMLEDKLRSAPDTSELQKRRDLLRKQGEAIDARRNEHGQALRRSMAGAYATIAAPAVTSFRDALDGLKNKGEIPGQISVQLITELLERGTCICGRHLADEADTRTHLLQELERAEKMGPLRSDLLGIHAKLGTIKALSDAKCRDAKSGYTGYWKETDLLNDNDASLEGVTLELQGVESVDRQAWEKERGQKQDELSNAMVNLKSLEQQLRSDAVELKELEKRLAESAEKGKTAAALHRKSAWAEAAATTLKEIIQEFATIARLDVEQRTEALWHRLMPNTRQYRVLVTEGFELSVESPAGAGGLAQLSMGQQHCLGLAFITSVAQASEMLPPLVIDMPFGRLDASVAANVAREMPSLTNQLVLFVLEGTEWNDQTRRALEPAIARVVRLSVDPISTDTRIMVQA